MFPVEGYVMDLFFFHLVSGLKVHPSLDPQVSAISRIQQWSNSAEKSWCESLRIFRGPRLEMITQHADVNRWKPQDV